MDRNHCLNFGGVETEPPHPQPSQSYNDDDDDRLEDAQAVGAVVISPGYVTDSIAAGELLGTQFGRRWFLLIPCFQTQSGHEFFLLPPQTFAPTPLACVVTRQPIPPWQPFAPISPRISFATLLRVPVFACM